MTLTLQPKPLTRERFALYGDVIEAAAEHRSPMNAARFERFNNLCEIDLPHGGRAAVSIARCRVATSLPYRIDMVERHPHGSQAFVPLKPCRLVIVVAPPVETVDVQDLRAFVTNGQQGVNYRPGTWHMPLIAFEEGQEFLIIDREADAPNCDEHWLDEPAMLVES